MKFKKLIFIFIFSLFYLNYYCLQWSITQSNVYTNEYNVIFINLPFGTFPGGIFGNNYTVCCSGSLYSLQPQNVICVNLDVLSHSGGWTTTKYFAINNAGVHITVPTMCTNVAINEYNPTPTQLYFHAGTRAYNLSSDLNDYSTCWI